jgi:nicotinate-nucleotide adenylyltransferase
LKVGILGGAFNPPHLGHLVLAQEAYSQLSLERVVWMPYGEPSHRVLEDDPGPEARFTMCEYAVGADARFAVSRMEIDRDGPVYTVDTLRELVSRAPGEAAELFLILGGDQAASLPSWRSAEEVLSLARVAAVERDEWRREEIVASVGPLCSSPDERLSFLDMPRIDISSSLVRARASAGQPIRYLVPDKVANYVGAQSLYGSSVPAAGSPVAAAPDRAAGGSPPTASGRAAGGSPAATPGPAAGGSPPAVPGPAAGGSPPAASAPAPPSPPSSPPTRVSS